MIHSLQRCIRQCMRSTTLTRTWWNGISNSLSFAYLHGYTEKMVYPRTRSYRLYYAVTKWNYYLQGAEVIICNDHKTLAGFLNGKNANNKVNMWGWNSQHITLPSIDYWEHNTKQLSLQTGRTTTWQASHSSDAHCHQHWWTHIAYQK